MPASGFATILPWVIANGYLMIFAAIIIGGPIFISAAAFAAALGYLNVYAIFSLAFFGEMAVDAALYLIGYISRAAVAEKFGRYFGLTDLRITRLEQLLHNHPWKTLLIIKYSPVIPVPGFVITGASKLPFKKFFYILLALSLPKAVFFTVIGYFFGRAYDKLSQYFYYGEYLIIGAVILFIIINYLFTLVSKKISREEIKM
ncbi:MAG: VTT domain-containing protein [bacterium]|nr:VTT domain-containing protein [bacterium]